MKETCMASGAEQTLSMCPNKISPFYEQIQRKFIQVSGAHPSDPAGQMSSMRPVHGFDPTWVGCIRSMRRCDPAHQSGPVHQIQHFYWWWPIPYFYKELFWFKGIKKYAELFSLQSLQIFGLWNRERWTTCSYWPFNLLICPQSLNYATSTLANIRCWSRNRG